MLSSYYSDNIQFYNPKLIKNKILYCIEKSINYLNLSSLGIKVLDISLFPTKNDKNTELDHITQLYLNDNYLNSLPQHYIGTQFINLNYLNISGNCLSQSLIRDTFKGLNNITTIIMDNIINLELPNNIFEYTPNIEQLKIGSLKNIPYDILYPLKHLKLLTLIFSSYELNINIPDTLFTKTTQIESINIIKGNIYYIPSRLFTGLDKIHTIMIKQTKLRELPNTLFKDLISLQNVYLTENKLYDIPLNIFVDNPIIKLDLSFNELEHLPKELYRVKSKAEQTNNKCYIQINNNPISNENLELLTVFKWIERKLPEYLNKNIH